MSHAKPSIRRPVGCAAFAVAAALLTANPGVLPAQETGLIVGRVVDAESGRPLADVAVSILGTELSTRTGEGGSYKLRKVPAGIALMRLQLAGYAATVERVVVAAQWVTLGDFRLSPIAVVLDEVIVYTEPEAERSPPASEASARVVDAKLTSADRVGDVLDRVPGAQALRPSGDVGSGIALRLRGVKSFFGSTEPLVYLDGVRVHGGSETLFSDRVRGQTILDLLDPSDIDRIEVLMGPAAAAQYGTGAADGIILIYTKRGLGRKP